MYGQVIFVARHAFYELIVKSYAKSIARVGGKKAIVIAAAVSHAVTFLVEGEARRNNEIDTFSVSVSYFFGGQF